MLLRHARTESWQGPSSRQLSAGTSEVWKNWTPWRSFKNICRRRMWGANRHPHQLATQMIKNYPSLTSWPLTNYSISWNKPIALDLANIYKCILNMCMFTVLHWVYIFFLLCGFPCHLEVAFEKFCCHDSWLWFFWQRISFSQAYR